MNDQQKNSIHHLQDEPISEQLPISDASKELVDTLEGAEKIVELKNFDNAFFEKILEAPEYQESLEHYSKKQKKLVDYTVLEIGQNVIRHGLTDIDKLDIPNVDATSKISIQKSEKDSYDEIEIMTENLFEKKEINQTGGGIAKFLDRINSINQKPPEVLDAEYEEEIKKTDLNTHGGGNLGLIDIARKIKKMYDKAANIFKAVITPINDHISKLTMVIKIPIPKSA